MKNLLMVVATLMLTIVAQAQDTLKVGNYTLVTYSSDTVDQYVLFSESDVVTDYLVPVGILGSKEEAINFIAEQADMFYSGYGVKEVEARELNRQGNIMNRFLNSIDTVRFTERQFNKYSSQLAGEYILIYDKNRSRITFDERLIAVRKGDTNLRMLVFSNNNIKIVNLETEPLDFYANKFGEFWGVDVNGNNVRLIKIERK